MDVPDDFEPVCQSFTEDEQKEHLMWIEIGTKQTYYPDFFRKELGHITDGVRYFVTRD